MPAALSLRTVLAAGCGYYDGEGNRPGYDDSVDCGKHQRPGYDPQHIYDEHDLGVSP